MNRADTIKVEKIIREKIQKKFSAIHDNRYYPHPTIIVENVSTVNEKLENCQYFFTDIVNEGILLHDSDEFKLVEAQELSFKKIQQIAIDEFNLYFHFGTRLLWFGETSYSEEAYREASFLLHQACEKFYDTISAVFTNYRPKSHRLEELSRKIWHCSPELTSIFPLTTDFEKHCFDLICRAYIEARYNKDFSVTKEECDYMIQRLEILKEVTNRLCTERIEHYNKLAQI